MSGYELTKTRLIQSVWEGILTGAEETPQIAATHRGTVIAELELTRLDDGNWSVRIPIPAEAIADGIQTIVMTDMRDGTQIGHLTLLAGDAIDSDIRAEIDLLRAELDLLKRAFRRHCVETGA